MGGSSLGDLPHPGIEPGSLAWQADSLPSETPGKTQKWTQSDRIREHAILRDGDK